MLLISKSFTGKFFFLYERDAEPSGVWRPEYQLFSTIPCGLGLYLTKKSDLRM
jgi:hypothetical protein